MSLEMMDGDGGGERSPYHHKARCYSAEGDAILREGYPAGTATNILLDAINACRVEGEPPFTACGLVHRVRKLKLHRPDWFRAEESRRNWLQSKAARKLGNYVPKRPPPRPVAERINRDEASDRQKPLALMQMLPPPRDHDFSRALLEMAWEIKDWNSCPCDRDTALTWGRRWADSTDIGVINAARRMHHLPTFTVRWA